MKSKNIFILLFVLSLSVMFCFANNNITLDKTDPSDLNTINAIEQEFNVTYKYSSEINFSTITFYYNLSRRSVNRSSSFVRCSDEFYILNYSVMFVDYHLPAF